MQVRVVRRCVQSLVEGMPPVYMRVGELREWEREGELPKCFVPADEPEVEVEVEVDAVDPSHDAVHPNLQCLDRMDQVLMALNRMDHNDSGQWTRRGTVWLPRVESVGVILSEMGMDPLVDRSQINLASPGFQRNEPE